MRKRPARQGVGPIDLARERESAPTEVLDDETHRRPLAGEQREGEGVGSDANRRRHSRDARRRRRSPSTCVAARAAPIARGRRRRGFGRWRRPTSEGRSRKRPRPSTPQLVCTTSRLFGDGSSRVPPFTHLHVGTAHTDTSPSHGRQRASWFGRSAYPTSGSPRAPERLIGGSRSVLCPAPMTQRTVIYLE